MHRYRILKGAQAQNEILAAGNEAVFRTFNITIPEKHVETKAEKNKEQTIIEPAEREPDPEERILQNAITKAETLMDTARKEADGIRQRAYQEGYDAGVEEGRRAGKEQALEEEQALIGEHIKELQEKIGWYVKDMENRKEMILEEYLDDLKNISLAIGEKIVQTSLRSSSDVVKKMILSATEKLKKTAWAKVYVAKTGEEMDLQGDAQLLKELAKLSDNVKIVIMDEAEPGTCIVELPHEIIDISAGTQMENIRDILNNARL